jgi:hypothetical protein
MRSRSAGGASDRREAATERKEFAAIPQPVDDLVIYSESRGIPQEEEVPSEPAQR